ncbi:glycosyltransferase [Commensalibacter sp. Nvir]|uniref:CgeB family protein n=1 Tax=Commensalibacter sp. Nvir TaxID=3069817 RepID=UPI0030C844DF
MKGSVIVCSGGRYESQANSQISSAIISGWESWFGEGNVISISTVEAAAAIKYIKPKIVFSIGSYLPESTYFGEVCQVAKKEGAVSVFWATEDPYELDANYRVTDDFDVIFTCDKWAAHFYDHPHVSFLPLAACEKQHYKPIDEAITKTIDVLFCGVAFGCRKDVMRNIRPSLANLNIKIIGPGWGEFGIGFSDARIEKDQLIELYQRSKIVLNLGRSLHFENKFFKVIPSNPGPRTFEAAAAGAMQFYHEENYAIHDYYNREEMAVFSTNYDFSSLLQRYLNDPSLIISTAKKAQQRTLRDHTYTKRIETVIRSLKEKGYLAEQ